VNRASQFNLTGLDIKKIALLPGFVILCLTFSGCDSERSPTLNMPLEPVPRDTNLPDIVFVSIDSLRFDHLGCYGYARETSPTIDKMAAEGAKFTQAVSTTSWTLPSHAAMFTGLYDTSHGVISTRTHLGENFVTLAEALKDAGYQTAGFYGGPYLHPTFGLDQGFDTYRSCMSRVPQTPDSTSAKKISEETNARVKSAHVDVTGPRTTAEVGRWLEHIDGTPFFLFLHLWDVHYDYIPPARYIKIFDPDYRGTITGQVLDNDLTLSPDMPARDLQHLIALYDSEIRFTDDTLRNIFDLLDQRGRFAETLIVITADHGEEFFDHGGLGHGKTLFDEMIRVPLILRWPGQIPAGLEIEDQVRLVDLMPTLLALAGASKPIESQGRDISPLLRGEKMPPEPALSELLIFDSGHRALRSNRQKLITEKTGDRYYDLVADPLEQAPQTANQTIAINFKKQLNAIVSRARLLKTRLGQADDLETAIDPMLCRRLRALGYLGDGADCPDSRE
jgi:arylsulfatase A-like enzyme